MTIFFKKCLLYFLLATLIQAPIINLSAVAATKEGAVAELEKKVLGNTYGKDKIEDRLGRLEENVFGQKAATGATIDQRIGKLNKVFEVPTAKVPDSFRQEVERSAQAQQEAQAQVAKGSAKNTPEEKVQVMKNLDELSEKLLSIINQERSFRQLRPVAMDNTSQRAALEHASYLVQSRQFSHFGINGKNPDRRYTEAGGSGKVEELVDGFFAKADSHGNLKPIDLNSEIPSQLMDAILQVPDKADIILSNDANLAGVSFVMSQDRRQLVAVIEIVTKYANLASVPVNSSFNSGVPVSGSVDGGYKFAWVGVAKREDQDTDKSETEPSPYFAPIDKVIYLDKTGDRAKNIAKTGGLILAMVAAPFTYGASMLVADILMQSVAQAYQAQDVEVRSGIRASESSFNGTVGVGEWGPGLYYISVWAFPGKSKKPVIVSRRTVMVS
jgi:uncharacterized protein YkwD